MKKEKDDFNLAARIDYGVKAGVREALIEHKKANRSIVVSKNGKIVHIPPNEIVIPDLPPFPF
jgi:hypothetical protein